MHPIHVYSLIVGGLLALLFLYQIFSIVLSWIQRRTIFYIFKYVIYPVCFRRRFFLGPTTCLEIILVVLYWAGTIVCNVVGVNSLPEAGLRAGAISLFHLIPLLLSDRLRLAADLLGLSPQSFQKGHNYLGFMAVLQGIVHVAAFLSHNSFQPQQSSQFYGLLSIVFLGSLFLSALLRPLQHELLVGLHLLLAILLVYALWRHLSFRTTFLQVYIIIASAIFIFMTTYRLLRFAFRNLVWGRCSAITTVAQVNDAIRLQIRVARPWNVKAGDYIYIWMPGVSFWSLLQTHPYMVAWSDKDADGNSSSIYLLIKLAWVDGPYGRSDYYNKYGNVLLFATGIGIAALVPCIKDLLHQCKLREACTRTIHVVWQLDKESDQDWVRDWMDILLNEDEGLYILRIQLYVIRQFEDQGVQYGQEVPYGDHNRIRKFYGRPDLLKLIETEIDDKRGRLLISTATDAKTQDQIRDIVQKHMVKGVRLNHLAFEPHERRWWYSAKLAEVKYQGVV